MPALGMRWPVSFMTRVLSPRSQSEPVLASGPFFNSRKVCPQNRSAAGRTGACGPASNIGADNGFRARAQGPPLDIDVLFYGDPVGDFDGLVLPRAEVLKNAFVLWPLSELAPNLEHPGRPPAAGRLLARGE